MELSSRNDVSSNLKPTTSDTRATRLQDTHTTSTERREDHSGSSQEEGLILTNELSHVFTHPSELLFGTCH